MPPITLGASPVHIDLELVPNGMFVCTLESEEGDWPATASITIEIGDAIWAAWLEGTEARFEVSTEDVETVIDQHPTRYMLWYTDGGIRLPWAAGSVTVYG